MNESNKIIDNKSLPKKNPRKFLFPALILVAVLGLFIFYSNRPDSPIVEKVEELVDQVTNEIPEGHVRRLTDGVYVPEEDQVDEIYAVMIENSADAWPLSGVGEARLVIEAPVEGSIPRLMAIYDDQNDQDFKIGSVRSARPYYVEWVKGLNAMYAHVGGSPAGLDLIRSISVPDLNQFYWGQFFWRSQDRYAPHNVFTNIEQLSEAYDEREFDFEEKPFFAYEEEPTEEGDITFIEIPFSVSDQYDAGWEYQREEDGQGKFVRHQNRIVREDNGTEMNAKNIIVLYTDVSVIDEVGRLSLRTLGEGEGQAFKNGEVYDIRWEKEKRHSPLKLYVGEEEYQLVPGRTWIEVVPLSTEVIIEREEKDV